MLTIYLRVKFRAFGITFGTYERTWREVLPFPLPPKAIGKTILDVDERGVRLLVKLAAVPTMPEEAE
jgi:hypothetical protein